MFKNLFKKKVQKETEKDLLILTSLHCEAGTYKYDEKSDMIRFKFVALVDMKTNTYSENEGYVCYLYDRTRYTEMLKNNAFELFQDRKLYRVKCKVEQHIALGEIYVMSEKYENESATIHPEMERLQKEYLNPPRIEDELGVFIGEKENDSFEGKLDWLGNPCEIILQCDGSLDSALAQKALERFKRIYSRREICDKNLKEYGKKKLIKENKEELSANMRLDSIIIFWDGQFSFHFSCGDTIKLNIYYFEENGTYGAEIYDYLKFDINARPQLKLEKLAAE